MTGLLTPDEAAALLGISRRSLERLVKDGRIRPLYPLKRRPRFEQRELDAYLAWLRKAA